MKQTHLMWCDFNRDFLQVNPFTIIYPFCHLSQDEKGEPSGSLEMTFDWLTLTDHIEPDAVGSFSEF